MAHLRLFIDPTAPVTDKVYVVVAWAFVWAALYALSIRYLTPANLPGKGGAPSEFKRIDWASRVVSMPHALWTGLAAAWYLGSGDLSAWSGFLRPHNGWERVVLPSEGFFLYDGLLVSRHWPAGAEKWATLFHQ